MKVNDKVICINGKFSDRVKPFINNFPIEDEIYTLRSIEYHDKVVNTGIRLNELVNPKVYFDELGIVSEPTFSINRFRLLEEISNELVKQEELVNSY